MDKRFPITEQLAALAETLTGRVVLPADADYDAIRAVVPANFDSLPAALIRVANAADVAAVLDFARASGLEVAIRSGGHSAVGHSGSNGGLVIDMRGLDAIEIDYAAQTVWAGAGLTAGQVTLALEPHGFVVPFGDTATVGISGLTLGGGIGYFVRKHGLTIDSVRAVEIVTAAGEVIVADEDNHSELFWAVRGGGGNFGVVTRWKFRMHALPAFTGGPLILPATPEVIAGFVTAAEDAPEELSAIASIMPAPPLPFLPAELHGKTVLMAMMAYAGTPENAERALARFRALATPLADLVAPAPYSSMYLPEDPVRMAFAVRSRLVDHIGVPEARAMIARVEQPGPAMHIGEIRVLGGAMGRISPAATAFAHRQSRIMLSFISVFEDVDAVASQERWAQDAIGAFVLGPDKVYVNFLSKGEDRIAAAYPGATWSRLRQVKRRYDPENLFQLNQNIPPA